MFKVLSKSVKSIVAVILTVTMALSVSARGYTVIIDPGHGAHDAGAVGEKGNEKSINLAVAKGVRDILGKEVKDCKVVMTRSDDTFIPLQRRADIANANHGDLFVSIHVNSVAKDSPNRLSVKGASVYTLGLEKTSANMEVARRENAVITLESDYTTKYKDFDPNSTESYIMFEMNSTANINRSIDLARSIQNELVATAGRADRGLKQAPFYVLVKTSMPAVLVELDFICNPEQEKFLLSDDGQRKMSRAVANGIMKFIRGNDLTDTPSPKSKGGKRAEQAKAGQNNKKPSTVKTEHKQGASVKKQTAAESKPTASKMVYKIQFMTSGRRVIPASDNRMKGLDRVEHYIDDDGTVKYTVGSFNTASEAKTTLKQVQELFPQAFLIKMKDGKRVR